MANHKLLVLLFAFSLLFVVGCGDDDDDPAEDMMTETTDDMADDTDEDTSDDAMETSDTAEETEMAECTDGMAACLDERTLQLCVDGSYQLMDCGLDLCSAEDGACVEPACPQPLVPYECDSATAERVCNADQTGYDVVECEMGEMCTNESCQ